MNLLVRIFLRSMSISGIADLISKLLFFGLVFICDGLLLLMVSSTIGGFCAIALCAGISLATCIVVGSSFARHSRLARRDITRGNYPKDQFIHLGGLMLSLILGIIPGLFTSFIAGILYLPFSRQLSGKILHEKFSTEFAEVYNYQRMGEE